MTSHSVRHTGIPDNSVPVTEKAITHWSIPKQSIGLTQGQESCLVSRKNLFLIRPVANSITPVVGNVEVKGLGVYYKSVVRAKVGKADLVSYVEGSGFASLENWWAFAQSLVKGKESNHSLCLFELSEVKQ